MSAFRPSTSPAFRLSILFIVGMLAGRWLNLSPGILVPAFIALALIVCCLVVYDRHHRLQAVTTVGVVLACMLGGAAKLAVDEDRSLFIPDSVMARDVLVFGRITEPPHLVRGVVRCMMEAREVRNNEAVYPAMENIRVSIAGFRNMPVQRGPVYGSTVAMRGKLSRPSDSHNPGEFSEKQYFEANGITLFMFVRGAENVVILNSGGGSWIMQTVVFPAREFILRTLAATTNGEASEFLKGLLIGERTGLSAPTRQAFTNSGVAHVLAVSGSNVVVVAGIFFFLFGVLRLPKLAVVFSSIVGLVFYMLITGSQPPVVRATITSTIFLIGSVVQTRANPFNSLGVAALIILGIDARQLFDVGFQLSFVAVLSIVYLYPKMNGWISIIGSATMVKRAITWVLRVCAVSVAASLGTLPLTAVYFGKVSIIGLLANIVVIPAVGGSVVLGFVTVVTGLFGNWIADAYAAVNQLLLDSTLWLIRNAGASPLAYADTSRFLAVYALPFYAALLLLFNLDVNHVARKLLIIFLVALNIAVFVPPPVGVAASERLRLSFLDVGQGDAAVVEVPGGKVIVIDAGPQSGEYDSGERTVAPYLRRRGISQIDLLIITHPDDDHLGGIPYILEQFEVREILESGQGTTTGLYKAYAADVLAEGCAVDTTHRGMIRSDINAVRIYVLSPPPAFIQTDTTRRNLNLNMTSVVVRMVYGRTSFLFTGDAETIAEREMVQSYGDFLQSTLLKVGHHGSKTSSAQEFLEAVQPEYAVISVGRFNKFRHPSQDALARLRGVHADVFRTDEEGAIIFETDGKTLDHVEWR